MDEALENPNPEMQISPKRNEDETNISDDEHNQMSDSESESDSEEEDEAEQNLQLQTLESDLSTNPSNYDAHIQYIKLLRKVGDVDKLRQAREAMNAVFPLSPTLWQEWARDEITMGTGPEAILEIEKLYERGVSDYLSVSLWCDYLNFIQEHDPLVCECSPAGVTKVRNLFERALTAAGLHVTEGSKIWEAFREYEQAILLTIDEAELEVKEKQVQRVRNIFHRQLSVPLADLTSTLQSYKIWEAEQGVSIDLNSDNLDGISPTVISAYQKALEMYSARVNLEEQISKRDLSESERHQNYLAYLKFEQSSGDPARVQVLYERAITEFPVYSDLWLDYTSYVDNTLKVGSIVREVYSRAVKNCPWVGELWVRYLLCLERGHASEKEISAVFYKSQQCTFSTLEEYLNLFVTRIDGLRRRILKGSEAEGVLDYSLIRETFKSASDYLSPHLKNTDDLLRLYAYWAHLEVKLGEDMAAARGVWESLVKMCGSMLEAWQGYIGMEIELGHINEARSIFKRCYTKKFPGTGSEDICHSWLRFEREYGTLDDFDLASRKVKPRLEELQLFRLQQEPVLTEQKENQPKKNSREKRKSGPQLADEQLPAKRKKEDKIRAQNTDDGNKAEEVKAEVDRSGSINEQLKDSRAGKALVYTDQCTAFVSNINLKAKYEDLRSFFSDVGGVSAIRILHDKFTGKSRALYPLNLSAELKEMITGSCNGFEATLTSIMNGLAYVDFSDDAHLSAALAKNKQMLLGKRLSIARSAPKQGRKGSGSRNSTEHARGNEQAGGSRRPATKESTQRAGESFQSNSNHESDEFQLKGRNTFAMPRAVRPLGSTANKPRPKEIEDENPKSNDEFRKIFLKE